jgi:hypothetical protein
VRINLGRVRLRELFLVRSDQLSGRASYFFVFSYVPINTALPTT